jgi:hypothetical protein
LNKGQDCKDQEQLLTWNTVGPQVRRDCKASRAPRVLRGHRVLLVLPDLPERKGPQAQQARRAVPDSPASRWQAVAPSFSDPTTTILSKTVGPGNWVFMATVSGIGADDTNFIFAVAN